jgi:hypothetical protein
VGFISGGKALKYECLKCGTEQEVVKKWIGLEVSLNCAICGKANFTAMSDQRRSLGKEMEEKARDERKAAQQ